MKCIIAARDADGTAQRRRKRQDENILDVPCTLQGRRADCIRTLIGCVRLVLAMYIVNGHAYFRIIAM